MPLPFDTAAPGLARRFVRRHLAGWEREDDAVLATSELVSNAVEHSVTPETLMVRLIDTKKCIRIEVVGAGTFLHLAPRSDSTGPTTISGRGLDIVSAVTDRVGAEATEGPTVWFEIDR